MSLTGMVLIPGEDYQQICDNLRASLDTTDPITSSMAADMTGTLRTEVKNAKEDAEYDRQTLDAFLIGPVGENYRNDRITVLRDYAFYYISGITGTIDFPNVRETKVGVFRNCSGVKQILLPKNNSLGNNAFNAAAKLELADIGHTKNISSTTFTNAAVLTELVIRKDDSPTTLAGVAAFNGTPFASGGAGGTVYVPAALIEIYKTATNWSTLYAQGTCQFAALEGSVYE